MNTPRRHRLPRAALAPALAASIGVAAGLAGCGGGGSDPTPTPNPVPTSPTTAQRTAAATATAQSATNPCAADAPFYWEVGDRSAKLASGSVNAAGNPTTYDSSTLMSIASASKWLYATYFVQKQNAVLTDTDITFMNFRSGYTSFTTCTQNQTVDGCVAYQNNGVYTAANDGKFSYGGGHMEKHASLNGLGALDDTALAAEIRSQLGTDVSLAYSQPQLAGGIVSTADDYAKVLRKMLAGQLQMGALLGTHAVCTNPSTCPAGQAANTPVPVSESWMYSIGHWVESDPVVGDGAFSSAGAFGFYPWIDATRSWYGVLARHVVSDGEGFDSVACGRLIRKAWVTGVAQ